MMAVAWVEPFRKPSTFRERVMGFATLNPSYEAGSCAPCRALVHVPFRWLRHAVLQEARALGSLETLILGLLRAIGPHLFFHLGRFLLAHLRRGGRVGPLRKRGAESQTAEQGYDRND